MNILQINGSARQQGANSTLLADRISERLLQENPGARLQVLDLASNPVPVFDDAAITALFTPADQRNAQQQARADQSMALVKQLQQADVLVLGVPMYNFGISSQLKDWIDNVSLNQVTFRYTANGPEGLLQNKRALVGFARGGLYRGTEADTQTPYFKAWLKFVGIEDVQFVYAEGLNMGDEANKAGFASAEQDLARALAR
ncbi:MAG: NAD(P)H-dependent oxidoreductase [Thiopseudomonas sp.]|nr:NAD(P)H-dependent oxidoreductase [Thiopseudomonas sp.]